MNALSLRISCTALIVYMFMLFNHANAAQGPSLTPPIDNPIVLQRADPWLVRHDETGCYTFIGTSPQFDEIELRQACRLNDLKLATPKVIWQKHESGPMSVNIWAPELHQIEGSWYVYFAAAPKDKPFNIRMYALKNSHKDPMQGTWTEEGQIKTHLDTFSLDATTFEHQGKRYLVWAQQDARRTYNSALWLAEMTSPTTIKMPVTLLSEPELEWEVQGYKVNEGAAIIKHGERIFITYSASATDDRYAMGLLWADKNADLTDAASWHKQPTPLLETNAALGRFGPGHNGFTVAEDGKTPLMIYHSRDYKELKGSPLSDPNRHARARVVGFDEQGMLQVYPERID